MKKRETLRSENMKQCAPNGRLMPKRTWEDMNPQGIKAQKHVKPRRPENSRTLKAKTQSHQYDVIQCHQGSLSRMPASPTGPTREGKGGTGRRKLLLTSRSDAARAESRQRGGPVSVRRSCAARAAIDTDGAAAGRGGRVCHR